MRKFREMLVGGNKGFTLIELLVVIAVLGILAGIAIPRITGITDQARKAELKATGNTIRNAIEMYIATENTFPASGSAFNFSATDYDLDVNLGNYIVAGLDGGGDDTKDGYEFTIQSPDDSTVTATISDGGVSTN